MAKGTLFAYTVEENEGKLLITIDGVLAENLIKQIREDAEQGRGGRLLAKVLPIDSLYRFLARPEPVKVAEGELSLEEILGQNMNQTLSSFEQQLSELRATLSGPPKPGAAK